MCTNSTLETGILVESLFKITVPSSAFHDLRRGLTSNFLEGLVSIAPDTTFLHHSKLGFLLRYACFSFTFQRKSPSLLVQTTFTCTHNLIFSILLLHILLALRLLPERFWSFLEESNWPTLHFSNPYELLLSQSCPSEAGRRPLFTYRSRLLK